MKPINTSFLDFARLIEGGYLTIDRRIDSETVVLRIPNGEVRDSLYDGYIGQLFGQDFELDDFELAAEETARKLVADEFGAKFAALLKTAFAKIPHEWLDKDEKEIKRNFLALIVFARGGCLGRAAFARASRFGRENREDGLHRRIQVCAVC